jgi:hypothetical protein
MSDPLGWDVVTVQPETKPELSNSKKPQKKGDGWHNPDLAD